MNLLRPSLFLFVVLGIGAASARAGTVSLAYSGRNQDNSFINALGSGSFSFATGATSVTLANLTAFSFGETTTLSDPGLSGSSSYAYGLTSLVSFSATFSATGALTGLSFRTGYANASNGFLNPQYFVLSSLRTNGATSYQSGPDGDVTTGTVAAAVVPAAVPEPASLTLVGLAVGTGGLAACRARRRRAARA